MTESSVHPTLCHYGTLPHPGNSTLLSILHGLWWSERSSAGRSSFSAALMAKTHCIMSTTSSSLPITFADVIRICSPCSSPTAAILTFLLIDTPAGTGVVDAWPPLEQAEAGPAQCRDKKRYHDLSRVNYRFGHLPSSALKRKETDSQLRTGAATTIHQKKRQVGVRKPSLLLTAVRWMPFCGRSLLLCAEAAALAITALRTSHRTPLLLAARNTRAWGRTRVALEYPIISCLY